MREIKDGAKVIAMIIELSNMEKGVTWYGVRENYIQCASRKYRGTKGKELKAHIHEPVVRELRRTQEAFILIEGKISVLIYDDAGKKLQEIDLKPGDCAIFFSGGHGFKVYSDRCVAYEIKSGSYANDVKEIENGGSDGV